MSKATRESFGTASLRSSSRLPLSSGEYALSPVTFPPGRARLAANPTPTGSAPIGMTIGMETSGQKSYPRNRTSLLAIRRERRKEADSNDYHEPDPPHGHLG
jgi:hypothetical protein